MITNHPKKYSPPRLALLTYDLVHTTGEGRISEAIFTLLAERGYKIELFTTYVESKIVCHPNVKLHLIPTVRWKDATMFLQFGLLAPLYYRLFRRKNQVDLVIANNLHVFFKHDLNICNFCHNSWLKIQANLPTPKKPKYLLLNLFHYYLAFIERKYFPYNARLVLADSAFTKTGLERDAGLRPEQVEVMINGVNLAEFTPVASPEQKRALQQKLGLPLAEDKIYLVFVGELKSPRKGLQVVLEALRQLNDSRLHLIVSGNTRGNIFEDYVKKLGLQAQVSFVGFQPQVEQVYQAGDIFVFPTFYDPWGLVIGEAMACGLPVISSASCGASQMVTEGIDGFIIPDGGDIEGLKQAITKLANAPLVRHQFGKCARKKAESYSWEGVVDRLEEEIKKAIVSQGLKARPKSKTSRSINRS